MRTYTATENIRASQIVYIEDGKVKPVPVEDSRSSMRRRIKTTLIVIFSFFVTFLVVTGFQELTRLWGLREDNGMMELIGGALAFFTLFSTARFLGVK